MEEKCLSDGKCVVLKVQKMYSLIFLDSSMVEHSAVNRRVVGSSPTRGVEAPWSSG